MAMKVESKRILQSIIYMLMGLQIAFGTAWILCNLGEVPRFEESRELLAMSETLVIDEYTGIMYPVCLRLAMTLEHLIGFPGCAVLYILQLAAAYLAYGCFLKHVVFYGQEMKRRLRNKVCFYAGFAMTIPTVVQVHMALLPYSLASSTFIVLLAKTSLLWRREYTLHWKKGLEIGGLWVLSAQLCPAYAWIAGVAVGISFLRYLMLHKQSFIKLTAVCLAAVLCVNVLNSVFQTEGSLGKIQSSVGAVMIARFVWPNFLSYKYFWGPEVTGIWDYAGLAELSTYPEKVIYEFGPRLEECVGKEAANQIYWEMSLDALKLGTKSIVLTLLTDFAAYVCPPLTMLVQLQGTGVSYTGWNYGRMKDYAPELTRYYVEYALGAWGCIVGLCLVQSILSRGRKRNSARKGNYIGVYFCLVSLFINLWYIMNNGHMQDYKRLIVNSVLWAFVVIYVLVKTEQGFGKMPDMEAGDEPACIDK
ncbi:MAG: hypothetical protein IJX63_01315 [Lachnospiraceae bacterium]|nr:hypothetical protein [Lachnospiraceae bacterium]